MKFHKKDNISKTKFDAKIKHGIPESSLPNLAYNSKRIKQID